MQGYKEILGLLDNAADLKAEERNALVPLFEAMQRQYDYILSEAQQNAAEQNPPEEIVDFEAVYESIKDEFEQHFGNLFAEQAILTQYDNSLPTVEELIGETSKDMTEEQLNELLDMQEILADTLQDAQENIDALIKRAWAIETQFFKLNKPKILGYIHKALKSLFAISVTVRRSAYCTYSHVPQLNTSLHHIYAGVDCYSYTTSVVVRVQKQTVDSVMAIRKNVFDLADIYKKIAAKHSIFGKLLTAMLNFFKAARRINETIKVAVSAMDALENELPMSVQKILDCGSNFADSIPQMYETITNLGTCLMYVDDDKPDYDFMLPEDEYNNSFNTDFPDLFEDAN